MILTKSYPSNYTFNSLFDELFNDLHGKVTLSPSNVPVNISENENGYSLDFNAPGRNKEDFKINVDNKLLTVSFEKKEGAEVNGTKAIRKEFTVKSFKRTFTLDDKINADNIEAKYENGILKVFLPKKEEVKITPKEISIQ